MNLRNIKLAIRNNEFLLCFAAFVYRFFGLNSIRKKNLKIEMGGALLRKCKIKNSGTNNYVRIGKGCRLSNCVIRIFGDNNCVTLDDDCVAKNMEIWISDGGTVHIGHNSHFSGKIHIECIEGKKISIGERCLFSDEIVLRTGDSHSIIDLEGKRINPSNDIVIGDHVWCGQQVVILKGAIVGVESVIGTRALVTGKQFPKGVVLAGSPAKVIKENISWHHQLL